MDGSLKLISAEIFIDRCKDIFEWNDLSGDVIMDVGCGEEGLCAKIILEKFPEVRDIICIDKDPNVAHNFKLKTEMNMECVIADIVRRDTLQNYEGRITKVISTHVFHQIVKKEEAFRNVYHLLRPGGEAALLFAVKNISYKWMEEIIKVPKWKALQKYYLEELYKIEFPEDQYEKVVEKIGFNVIECKEAKRVLTFPSDKEDFYPSYGKYFCVPSELLEEFKEECYEVLLKMSERDAEGRPCCTQTELCLLISKPTESSGSETEGNLDS